MRVRVEDSNTQEQLRHMATQQTAAAAGNRLRAEQMIPTDEAMDKFAIRANTTDNVMPYQSTVARTGCEKVEPTVRTRTLLLAG